MTSKDESVLVVPAAALHEAGVFHGFSPRVEHYLPRLLEPGRLSYLPRSQAETDPAYKQIIPYVVLRCGDQVFHYVRGQAGNEARLRGLRSVGIGGHISAEDDGDLFDRPYGKGMLREVAEEVHLESPFRERCLGLINDDSNPVGHVHLGIVHVFELEAPAVRHREQALTESGFAPLADLRRRRAEFETWSQFVLDVLGETV
jgi:predicted NUDIX family phosphoesterase